MLMWTSTPTSDSSSWLDASLQFSKIPQNQRETVLWLQTSEGASLVHHLRGMIGRLTIVAKNSGRYEDV